MGVIRRMEDVRTGDDRGRTGIAHLPRIFAAQSTIYFDHRVETAVIA